MTQEDKKEIEKEFDKELKEILNNLSLDINNKGYYYDDDKQSILDFVFQKLEEAYQKGKEEELRNGLSESVYSAGRDMGRQQTLNEVREMIENKYPETEYGCNAYDFKDDLLEELDKLYNK